MKQMLCGKLYFPVALLHRERGLTVDLFAIDYTSERVSASDAEVTLRRYLRDRVFMAADDTHIYGPDVEYVDGYYDVTGGEGDDSWSFSINSDRVHIVHLLPNTTPPKCFRCSFSDDLQRRLMSGDDGHITILSTNIVRTPAQDPLGRLGLHRVQTEPLQAITFGEDSVACFSAFRMGYSEQQVGHSMRKPTLLVNGGEALKNVNLPKLQFESLTVGPHPLRMMMFGDYDFLRAAPAFGEPRHEFTMFTDGKHYCQLIPDSPAR